MHSFMHLLGRYLCVSLEGWGAGWGKGGKMVSLKLGHCKMIILNELDSFISVSMIAFFFFMTLFRVMGEFKIITVAATFSSFEW